MLAEKVFLPVFAASLDRKQLNVSLAVLKMATPTNWNAAGYTHTAQSPDPYGCGLANRSHHRNNWRNRSTTNSHSGSEARRANRNQRRRTPVANEEHGAASVKNADAPPHTNWYAAEESQGPQERHTV